MAAELPSSVVHHYRLGVAAQEAKAYADAVTQYERALHVRHTFRPAAARRAMCELMLAESTTADRRLTLLYRAIDGFEHAIAWPATHLPVYAEDAYDPNYDHYALGYAYESLRRFTEAKSQYDAYLIGARDPGAQLRRANLLWKMGELAQAEAAYRESLAEYPTFVEARNNLAQLLVVLNKPTAAEAIIKSALHDANAEWLAGQNGSTRNGPIWPLYDTLATAYIAMAIQFGNDDPLKDALAALNTARMRLRLPAHANPGDPLAESLATIQLRRAYCLSKDARLSDARLALNEAARLAAVDGEVQLAALRNLTLLPTAPEERVDISLKAAGLIVVVAAFLLMAFSMVELAIGKFDSAGFAAVSISSLGVMLLGFALPRLSSFKLGGAEATLSQQVVVKTSFELTEIAPPNA